MHKTLKTIVATLLLGSAAVTFAAQVQAAPTFPSQQELNWMNRASQNDGVGGN